MNRAASPTTTSDTGTTSWEPPDVATNRSSTEASASSPTTTNVRGKEATPSPPKQCFTTIGASTNTPAGTVMTIPPRSKAAWGNGKVAGQASAHPPSASQP